MGYRHNTGQNKTVVNSRSIRKGCDKAILIAFAATMLAVCISPALASATYIPPNPTNLMNITGSEWVNYTWQAGSGQQHDSGTDVGNNSTLEVFGIGNVTDSYNVSLNDKWHNGTTNTPLEETFSSGGWVNISVWAWNVSGNGTLSADCVGDNVQAQAGFNGTFVLVGSIPTGSDGGGGTYPPGWFETPAPAVTATKALAAPAATATAADAPPGERVTPTPAPTKMPAAAKATTPAAEGTTAETTKAETTKKDAPGFTAVFMIAGMLAAVYAVMRQRRG